MEWWSWVSVGVILLAAELFIPSGMYLLIIGLSLVIVGILSSLGITELVGAGSFEGHVLIATIISIAMIFTVRNMVKKLFMCCSTKTKSDIASQTVIPNEDIPSGSSGRGELLGVPWTIKNESKQNLTKGQQYSVTRVDGITLVIGD
jgi:membrane protein implicated in regulation of membrane protease activity